MPELVAVVAVVIARLPPATAAPILCCRLSSVITPVPDREPGLPDGLPVDVPLEGLPSDALSEELLSVALSEGLPPDASLDELPLDDPPPEPPLSITLVQLGVLQTRAMNLLPP